MVNGIKVRLQALVAIAAIAALAGAVTWLAPEHIVEIVGSAITGIGILGMKSLESGDK